MPKPAKWFAWSKDEHFGRWMVVNEGLEPNIRAYVKRLEAAAAKYDVTATFAALPEGTEPDA